jgi:hypothetical protein
LPKARGSDAWIFFSFFSPDGKIQSSLLTSIVALFTMMAFFSDQFPADHRGCSISAYWLESSGGGVFASGSWSRPTA